jgi:hypothetical protein
MWGNILTHIGMHHTCSALSLHELFDFRCEFVVLP